jgi:DNA-binding FrmR family transcriptional regulator
MNNKVMKTLTIDNEIQASTKALLHRLNRIQGQIEALKNSIASTSVRNGECLEHMRQIKAVHSGIKAFGEAYVRDYALACAKSESVSPHMRKTMEEIVSSAFTL